MTKPTTILILLILNFLLINPACYAKVRYVNTASVGGDGTTNNLTGVTAAYKSLFDWEAAEDGNLLTEPMTVYCEGTAADQTAVTINGWTGNSATNYIKITTTQANRHNGVWDNTKYRLSVSGSHALEALDILALHISGLQISSDSGYQTVRNRGAASDGALFYFYDNILDGSAGTWTGTLHLYTNYGTTMTAYIYNNVIVDTGTNTYPIMNSGSLNTIYAYNNTLVNKSGTYCFFPPVANNDVLKNNILITSGTEVINSPTMDYNASDDATGIGTNAQNLDSTNNYENEFVDYVNNNFRLLSSSAAKDHGTDLSNDANLSFSDDIQGQSRPWGGVGSWDIGADEAAPQVGLRIGGY